MNSHEVFIPFAAPRLPEIPQRDFIITDYGALSDGVTSNSTAFSSAIEAAVAAGGGRVVVPTGTWLTGPIHLRSRIDLHLEEGAEVLFSKLPEDYLPVVYSQRGGSWCYNYSPLLYARDCCDVAVSGSGVLNGQGEDWWPWKKRQPMMVDLQKANNARVPVEQRRYGTREAGIRPPMLQFIDTQRVLIEGVTLCNSPSWTVHPVCCQELTIRGVKVLNPDDAIAPNTDGINPDSCRNVLIEDCFVDTGDDGICLKAGRDADGWALGVPCKNVHIRRCTVHRAHGGIVIGSEMSAGVRNVLAEDCVFDDTDCGVRIKSRPGRGGVVECVQAERITMRRIRQQAVIITSHYGNARLAIDYTNRHLPEIRTILLRQINCESAAETVQLAGLQNCPLKDISILDSSITGEKEMTVSNVVGLNTAGLSIHCQRNTQ